MKFSLKQLFAAVTLSAISLVLLRRPMEYFATASSFHSFYSGFYETFGVLAWYLGFNQLLPVPDRTIEIDAVVGFLGFILGAALDAVFTFGLILIIGILLNILLLGTWHRRVSQVK